jgi:hypothetical protein
MRYNSTELQGAEETSNVNCWRFAVFGCIYDALYSSAFEDVFLVYIGLVNHERRTDGRGANVVRLFSAVAPDVCMPRLPHSEDNMIRGDNVLEYYYE